MLERVTPWPPDYIAIFDQRQARILNLRKGPEYVESAKAYYKNNPIEFIEHWGITVETRTSDPNFPTTIPFILFKRQRDLVQFILSCLNDQESGLIEKSRDMGATWVCCALSVWLWLFRPGVSIGWSSRVLSLVDVIGDPKSIFQKMRLFIMALPKEFHPKGFREQDHLSHNRLINPETGAVISGEGGDNIGRGGRTLIYFKDESAHYERPELIEAALTSNTNCQIDISSVHGIGNVFHQKREAGIDWSPGAVIPKGKIRVFVLDWRDHPAKTQSWYDINKQSFIDRGLQHVWAQEVDRNYGAAVVGTIIKQEWVQASYDAYKHLHIKDDTAQYCAALDIADGGGDTNALAIRRGNELVAIEEWGERDTGVTARRAINACKPLGTRESPIQLQYDRGGGYGAAFKAEHNRLVDEDQMPRTVRPVPWDAGGEVFYPEKRIVPRDRDSMLNKDFYANPKAQGWWELRRRFEITYRARTEKGFTWDPEDIISINSKMPLLRKLEKELCQPTMGQSSNLKLLVNKQPEGMRSPNLADAVMMCFWPAPTKGLPSISDALLRRI